ncbi:ww domain u1 zinc finger domain-containing protein [Cyclospora cayetanensis]|uniref:Ww domain u1 zinc finger domain-containing protein n=1 Tax=Cyclospora cayetanensis TaxID=88456 RepID=A0A1D3DAU4_9EIME|nr:ww domain u1 zinc finger domain-containing protein [Cyclospora cayetanensis]
MTERWVSQKKHYCQICNTWLSGHVMNVKKHEQSTRHLENARQQLSVAHQRHREKEQQERLLQKELQQMEAAAAAAMHDDETRIFASRGWPYPAAAPMPPGGPSAYDVLRMQKEEKARIQQFHQERRGGGLPLEATTHAKPLEATTHAKPLEATTHAFVPPPSSATPSPAPRVPVKTTAAPQDAPPRATPAAVSAERASPQPAAASRSSTHATSQPDCTPCNTSSSIPTGYVFKRGHRGLSLYKDEPPQQPQEQMRRRPYGGCGEQLHGEDLQQQQQRALPLKRPQTAGEATAGVSAGDFQEASPQQGPVVEESLDAAAGTHRASESEKASADTASEEVAQLRRLRAQVKHRGIHHDFAWRKDEEAKYPECSSTGDSEEGIAIRSRQRPAASRRQTQEVQDA